ncbi:hypothetical protein EOPP23_13480 [Endozoicomonas sp. OPT23]|uniref:nucleoside hydrolase n=1 Tax=Endozoicomonas sp. OPT23 TaxID=2072845 RepID=UPI00129AC422|nr:nucleoside hydrolase [Endozoicomonas sp. OPT23]MRI34002.1 hypothetical protein [Endozoicomonas sp. OPT23]
MKKLALIILSVYLFLTSLQSLSAPLGASTAITQLPVIVDLDADFEDVTALAYLERLVQLSLMGQEQQQFVPPVVTMVCTGFGLCDNANNIKGIYSLLNMIAPAIGSGREQAQLFPDRHFSTEIRHEADNLYGLLKEPMGSSKNDAVEVLWDKLKSLQSGKAVILALGPLTNIADLLDRYPQSEEKIDRIFMMGGAVTVGGNVAYDDPIDFPEYTQSEWNIFLDPVSASKVLSRRHSFQVYMVPLDSTNFVPYSQQVFQQFGALANKTTSAAVVYQLLQKNPQFYKDPDNTVYFWNTLTAMLMANESLLSDPSTEIRKCRIEVDQTSSATSGRTTCTGAGDINVVTKVSSQLFYQQLFNSFSWY